MRWERDEQVVAQRQSGAPPARIPPQPGYGASMPKLTGPMTALTGSPFRRPGSPLRAQTRGERDAGFVAFCPAKRSGAVAHFLHPLWDHGKRAMPIRILLADDHLLFREMLRETLGRRGETYTVVGEAAKGAEILTLLTQHQPDLLLLDYKMPGLGRLSTFCQEVTRCSPTTRILLVSGYTEEAIVLEAAAGGAQGYLMKGAPLADLFSAIAAIQAGGIWVDRRLPSPTSHAFLLQRGKGAESKLSRRELHILSLVAQGMSNREIGVHLRICQKTVKNHITHLFAKLGVATRQQAALTFGAEKKPSDQSDIPSQETPRALLAAERTNLPLDQDTLRHKGRRVKASASPPPS